MVPVLASEPDQCDRRWTVCSYVGLFSHFNAPPQPIPLMAGFHISSAPFLSVLPLPVTPLKGGWREIPTCASAIAEYIGT